ncbi:RDD family protein [Aeribacillus sp. FSL M8-0254]|jgi:Predicted membrane protein/domain|uniref:RDD family protein n=1 Tax=Aeribacillus sp. FSL M8-0254 TaxID=2954577 RepID=UPI0030FC7EB5
MDGTFEEINQIEQKREVQTDISYHFAGFWMRFWAYLLDLIVVSSVIRIVANPLFLLIGLEKSDFIFSPYRILSALFFFSYFILMTKFLGQTLGKMVFGLRVISLKNDKLTWIDVFFREWIGRYISKVTWIGYLIVAFTKKKQGLHDLFSDTTVIHDERFSR